MNVNRTEGCLWHNLLPEQEKRQSTKTTGFIQLMAQVAEMPDGSAGKAVLRQKKQRYRLEGGSAAGLICEIEMREGITLLKVLVPRRDLYCRLKDFFTWLNAGLLEIGHNVTLEVEYDADLC
ncbi:Secretion system apparatus protein ssaP [Morganella morganii]|uniref:Secretion system apparatus protein ssaP n=1 Tax=Morganella TaxID=581 RepID=UPI00370ABA14